MYLGRYQNGDWVPLRVRCVDASLDAINPEAAPDYVVYSDTFSDVASGSLPPKDKDKLAGLFEDSFFLGSLDTGFYTVRYSWSDNSREIGASIDNFEIIGGGDASGSYTSMHFFGPPHADFVVGQLDSDTVDKRRNPRV